MGGARIRADADGRGDRTAAGPGYLLHRDAVSTPRSHLSDAALGLGGAAPRAVPQDFLIAVTSTVLDGGFVVKALLLAGLVCAGGARPGSPG